MSAKTFRGSARRDNKPKNRSRKNWDRFID
jgi:hypothetical protein